MSKEDGVVFLSIGNEDVVIDLVTAERSEKIEMLIFVEQFPFRCQYVDI